MAYLHNENNSINPLVHDIGMNHDDVIKWKHFPRYWPFVRGIHRSPVNSLHKGQWRRALMCYLISVWINGWVNNRETGDLRRHRAHYGVIVVPSLKTRSTPMWMTQRKSKLLCSPQHAKYQKCYHHFDQQCILWRRLLCVSVFEITNFLIYCLGYDSIHRGGTDYGDCSYRARTTPLG